MRFLGRQGDAGPIRDQVALFLGERRIQMQHERIGVRAKLGDDERDAAGHEIGDERHVPRQAVELGDDDRRLGLAGHGQRGGELRAPVERVGAFAGFDFDKLGEDFAAFRLGEPGEGGALGLDAQTGLALLAVETRMYVTTWRICPLRLP